MFYVEYTVDLGWLLLLVAVQCGCSSHQLSEKKLTPTKVAWNVRRTKYPVAAKEVECHHSNSSELVPT